MFHSAAKLTIASVAAIGLLSACASQPPEQPRPQPPRTYQPAPPPPPPEVSVPGPVRSYGVTRTTKLRAAPYLDGATVMILEEGNTYDLIVKPTNQPYWKEVVVAATGERGYLSGDVLTPLN